MFLIADRWWELTTPQRTEICTRILDGFAKPSHLSEEEFNPLIKHWIARRGRWLQKQGCEWPIEKAQELDALVSSLGDWSDEYSNGAMVKRGTKGGWVRTDDAPAALIGLPISEIIDRATSDFPRDFDSLTDRRPFSGLVKSDPRRAVAALTYKGKRGEFPETFWSSLIKDWPKGTSARLTKLMLHRVTQLPKTTLRELRYTIGDWLRQKLKSFLELDSDLAWELFDQCVSAFVEDISGDSTVSGLGETRVGGEIVNRSRRTYGHAINGPIGELTQGLTNCLSALEPQKDSGIPTDYKNRIERLLAAPGEGSDHAVAILSRDIPWFDHIDPEWTASRLMPLLAFDHPAAEPAWNGLLSRGKAPNSRVLVEIKSLLLSLFPKIYTFEWDRDLAKVAATWLMWMAMFRRDQADGISAGQARDCLRNMSSETRNDVIFWIGQVGKGNENGWTELVAPFISDIWPREKAFRTSAAVSSWIGLLDDTGEHFPVAYSSVKPHLAAIDGESHWLYRFARGVGGDKPIAADHPAEVLDMMNTITAHATAHPPYELKQILDVVADSNESLVGDPRFNRLLALTERD